MKTRTTRSIRVAVALGAASVAVATSGLIGSGVASAGRCNPKAVDEGAKIIIDPCQVPVTRPPIIVQTTTTAATTTTEDRETTTTTEPETTTTEGETTTTEGETTTTTEPEVDDATGAKPVAASPSYTG